MKLKKKLNVSFTKTNKNLNNSLDLFTCPSLYLKGKGLDKESIEIKNQYEFEKKLKKTFKNASISERKEFLKKLKDVGIKTNLSKDEKIAIVAYNDYFKGKNGSRISKDKIGSRILRSTFFNLESGIIKTTLTSFSMNFKFEKCIITKKVDGSLCTVLFDNDKWIFFSRRMLDNSVVKKAKELINTKVLNKKYTYIFEIYDKRVLTKENNLITLITIKDDFKRLEPSLIINESKNIGIPNVFCYGLEYTPLVEVKKKLIKLPFLDEGFVVITPTNNMVKMKTSEWCIFKGKDNKKKVCEFITAMFLERNIDFNDNFIKEFILTLPKNFITIVKDINNKIKNFLEEIKDEIGKKRMNMIKSSIFSGFLRYSGIDFKKYTNYLLKN